MPSLHCRRVRHEAGEALGAIGTEECLSAVRQHVQVRLSRCWDGLVLVCLPRGDVPVGGAAACAGEADSLLVRSSCCWFEVPLRLITSER